MLFDSLTDPIPRLRPDLELLPHKENGEDLLVLRDPAGYTDEMLMFRPEAWALFSLFDGSRSIEALQEEIQQQTRVRIDTSQILQIVQSLDKALFLSNAHFEERRERMDDEYLQQTVRRAALAGQSYPEDPEELVDFFSELFEADGFDPEEGELLGIIAPHIDLKIGPQVYVPAFKQLKAAEFDTVVILGTSHYSFEDLFILTEKDFETPLGTLKTDREFVRALHDNCGNLLTTRDIAHKQEHSIEFPVLFLQHLLDNDSARIVPILCTSFEEFLVEGTHALADEKYDAFIKGFHKAVTDLGRRVVFVLSVDWSHIGRKFGDDADAADILDSVRASDHEHFRFLEACDYSGFYDFVRTAKNDTHIDGFACITTFFDLVAPRRGRLLDYQQWHEEERASSVSFASMAFFGGDEEGDAA